MFGSGTSLGGFGSAGRGGDGGARSPSARTLALYLIGIAGLAFSITILFIEMRAVLDVGGSCADGGPYVSAQPCPDGTWLMFLAIFGGFGWGALAFGAGVSIGGRYASVPYLSWSALFCSLGFNFLQYGLASPQGGGLEFGFLIPGVLFELMGGIPLLVGLRYGGMVTQGDRDRLRAAQLAAGLRTETTATSYPTLSAALSGLTTEQRSQVDRALSSVSALASTAAPVELSSGTDAATGMEAPPTDLAGELERLADLHARGSLTDDEFAAAKAALLR